MEETCDLLNEIKIPTKELKSELLQKLLFYSQKKAPNISPTFWDEVTEVLWNHLQKPLCKFDDQLLCATCFYTVLIHSSNQEYYMHKILELLANETEYKREVVTSLMYGIYQSPFLSTKNLDCTILGPLLQTIFSISLKMGYTYSKFTFIIFKTISAFKKICGSDLEKIVFHEVNQIKLLNLINHNWESPVTGVRDLIKDIFQTLLTILNQNTYVTLLREIHELYWNKAKYLMLSKVIELDRGGTNKIIDMSHLVEGLIKSLYKMGVVSAGADLYYAVLKKVNSETEWCEAFLKEIVHILNSTSSDKAIENFNNYWLLITCKKFPSLYQVILGELAKVPESPQKLFSTLYITKQANKLCLTDKDFSESKDREFVRMISNGLENCNNHIRMLAFDIVCVSHKKSMPTTTEYNFVLDFINYNINTDCTVLRISMLNSLNIFLTQLHISYINNLQNDEDEQSMLNFCFKFQQIVLTSLNLNGNYQRKITCIKLAKLFLSSLNEIPRKRQKQTRLSMSTVVEAIKAKNMLVLLSDESFDKLISLLDDPAEDVRDNVIELLLSHFHKHLRKTDVIDGLISKALTKNESKFFYEINCGQCIFKLLTNILLQDKHQEAKFKSVEELFDFAYNELISEYNLQRGVVESIENGKQPHALINTLHTILKTSYDKGYEIIILREKMNMLLDTLDSISNQFAWEKDNSTSSDFSKISDMVEDMVKESNCRYQIDMDNTTLSGLHQIVLNCLWLNVKASCDLASLLIQHKMDISNKTEVCEKSLRLIVHVLETCRHKGAIEAAGVALGQSIRYLTSLPENSDLSKLPQSLLERKLTSLISEAGKMASITRRGAGLSIMVHRIVANDIKKGKPLYHYFIKTLLEACGKTEDFPTQHEINDVDNERDLPKAIFIHFLTRIVTDSSLASDTMFYAPELAELAFSNLINKYWQIRNAALQLYGALVPKLIGQKKQSGTEDETVATVACDELRTHFPELWEYIISKLKNCDDSDKLQYHSNLVPVLNILANMAPRYNFLWDLEKQTETDVMLLDSLFSILDSPIYTVRRLTAKCIYNITNFTIIHGRILNTKIFSENFLHGCLILLNCYKKDIKDGSISRDELNTLKLRLSSILKEKQHSYLGRAIFDDLFLDNTELCLEQLHKVISEVAANSHAPGIHLWKNVHIRKYLTDKESDQIPEYLNILKKTSDFEYCCEILLDKINNESSQVTKELMQKIASILKDIQDKFDKSIMWKLLYKISLEVKLDGLVITDISNYLQNNKVSYKLRYLIPLIVRLSTEEYHKNLINISNIIYKLTDAETNDIDMRYIAAIANNEIGKIFDKVPDIVKITAIKSAVVLLQDEDDEVRNISVDFYGSIINDEENPPHSYMCLLNILELNVLRKLLSEGSIQELASNLEDFIALFSGKPENDELNPFANDTKNIYMEVNVLQKLVRNLKC